MRLHRTRPTRALAGLIGFVASATLLPTITILVAFAVLAVTALGPSTMPSTTGLRRVRRILARTATLTALVTIVMLAVLLALVGPAIAGPIDVSPSAGAGIARLRVYPYGDTGDPALDPDYVGASPDPWLEDSWVLLVSGNVATFSLNVTNRHSYQAYAVKLRISVNDISLLTSISLTITQGDAPNPQTLLPADFAVGTPTLWNGANWPGHGIFPTSYANYTLGGIGPLSSANDTVVISIAVNGDFVNGLKLHFDADGWTILDNNRSPIANADPNDTNVRNPNSADTTVQIPSVTSVVLPAALAGLVYVLVVRKPRRRG